MRTEGHQQVGKRTRNSSKLRFKKQRTHQVSLIIFHPRSSDKVVLLTPPVTKATEEVVGEEPVDWVPDNVYIHGLLYPEPYKVKSNTD